MKGRFFLAAVLASELLLTAGCGQESLDDQFIFGKNRISCANETITVEVPFELGVQGQMADLAPKDSGKVSAEGHNRYMQVLVTGEATDKTAETQAAEAVAMMRQEASVTDLQEKAEPARIGETEGVCLTFSFTDTSRGQPAALTVKEYIFRQDRTLWRVIYQYRTEDPVGKALAERIEGQIVQGATF